MPRPAVVPVFEAVGQSVAQVPAHRQHDDPTRKRNPAKLDLGGGTRWRRRIGSACLKLSSTTATVPTDLTAPAPEFAALVSRPLNLYSQHAQFFDGLAHAPPAPAAER
jgi:hypothetical protein